MKSWETTVAGLVAIVGVIVVFAILAFDGNPDTTPGFQEIVTAIVGLAAGLGLIRARDNNKRSEDAGAKGATYNRSSP